MTKLHPADVAAATRIRSAVSFHAFYRNGPFEKYRTDPVATYAEAKADAAALVAKHSRFGRGAIVYANLPLGQTEPCDDRLVAIAGRD